MQSFYILCKYFLFALCLLQYFDNIIGAKTVSAPALNYQCGKRGRISIIFRGSSSFARLANPKELAFNSSSALRISPKLSVNENFPSIPKDAEQTPRSRPVRSTKLKKVRVKPFRRFTDIKPIAGGRESFRNSWPWMALLWKYSENSKNTKEFFCSGVLISENFVLTAAHCILDPATIYVRLGEHNVKDSIGKAIDFEIVEFIFHPKYEEDLGYNDLALLRLKKNVNFSNHIRPVCLPWGSMALKNYNNKLVTVTGWGSLKFGGVQSNTLQEVNLFVFENSRCEQSYSTLPGYRSTFPEGMSKKHIVCAGTYGGGKDACNGDSGGPLVISNGNGIYTLIGIVSKGHGCGKKNFPGLYAPMTNLNTLKWIKKEVF